MAIEREFPARRGAWVVERRRAATAIRMGRALEPSCMVHFDFHSRTIEIQIHTSHVHGPIYKEKPNLGTGGQSLSQRSRLTKTVFILIVIRCDFKS